MCTPPHYAKKQPFQTSDRKIHSNRNILHKHLRQGGVERLSSTIQNIVNNRAVNHRCRVLKPVLSTVLLLGDHFGQRILNSEDHSNLCHRTQLNPLMVQRPFATRIIYFVLLSTSIPIKWLLWKDPSDDNVPRLITFQPLLMTEVEQILSAVTACVPIFSIMLSRFQQWNASIFFSTSLLMETNLFQ